jgi:small ligand-binding sensory domain FIST
LPDPFSCDTEVVLHALDRALPAATIVGGLASGGATPGAHALYCGETVQRAGLVGVALTGNVVVETVVAQGCRPIGDPLFVTRADGHVISELDGRRPLEVLQALAEAAPARDRRLFGHSLFVGIVMRAHQGSYRHGDFLIRNIIGLDGERGAIAVGASVEPGAVVQFHLRDAETSASDLTTLLERQAGAARPAGALLFSCLGRGESLYGEADHDSEAVRRHLGEVPVGGFFCNGEIGPVQGATFLHGYTSAFGLFRQAGSRPTVP